MEATCDMMVMSSGSSEGKILLRKRMCGDAFSMSTSIRRCSWKFLSLHCLQYQSSAVASTFCQGLANKEQAG